MRSVHALGISGAIVALFAGGVSGQVAPDPDSLVARFVSDGPVHNLGPSRVFDGCPQLAPWQESAFRLLASADLSLEREGQLAAAWSYPLKHCGDARLEQWYIGRFDRLFADGVYPTSLHWIAIRRVESDALAAFFLRAMEDPALEERIRSSAGFAYLESLSGEAKWNAFLQAFGRRTLPRGVAWGLTTSLLMEDADALIAAVGPLVRSDPELTKQVAFVMIVESRSGQPSEAALRALANDVRAAAAKSTDPQHRQWLGNIARHLETRGRGAASGGRD